MNLEIGFQYHVAFCFFVHLKGPAQCCYGTIVWTRLLTGPPQILVSEARVQLGSDSNEIAIDLLSLYQRRLR